MTFSGQHHQVHRRALARCRARFETGQRQQLLDPAGKRSNIELRLPEQ